MSPRFNAAYGLIFPAPTLLDAKKITCFNNSGQKSFNLSKRSEVFASVKYDLQVYWLRGRNWTGEKHSAKKIPSSSGSKNSPIKWIDLVKKNLITQNQMFTFVQLLFNLQILGTVENLIFIFEQKISLIVCLVNPLTFNAIVTWQLVSIKVVKNFFSNKFFSYHNLYGCTKFERLMKVFWWFCRDRSLLMKISISSNKML